MAINHPNSPAYQKGIRYAAAEFIPKPRTSKSGSSFSQGAQHHQTNQSSSYAPRNDRGGRTGSKTYERFRTSGGFRHGGDYTVRQAWHSGGHGGRYGDRRGSGRGRGRNRREAESMDISRFIKKASGIKAAPVEIKNSFVDFNLNPYILRNLLDKKFTTPSPIQDQAIPHILQGRDMVGLANTGTGKTAAFLLPLLHKISLNPQTESALIVAPTRELAQQIDAEFRLFAKGLNLYSVVCVGGMSAYQQIRALRYNPHVVIGTPGRIQDLAAKGFIDYNIYNNVVIDEVDHMLDMGFVEPITEILNALPKSRQSLFFSATMPQKIRELIHLFLNNPVTVEIQSGKTTDNVDQDVVRVARGEDKFPILAELLKKPEMNKVLIFSETKRDVEKLTQQLIAEGFKATSIHGDKDQRERTRALNFFKSGMVTILVATDVAARGIDVNDISHVINYTIPQTHDDYVHRIGRTGRGSKTGSALTFV